MNNTWVKNIFVLGQSGKVISLHPYLESILSLDRLSSYLNRDLNGDHIIPKVSVV
jgi:hypothetical protein